MPQSQMSPARRIPRVHRTTATAFLLLFALASLPEARACAIGKPASQNPLNQEISGFEENAPYMSEMLSRIAQKYGARFGIDLGGDTTMRAISIHVAQGTVADLIKATIDQTPGYKWVQRDGIVSVTPEKGANTLLDLTIAHFRIRHATPVYVHDAICRLPEVKAWLKQNQLTEHTTFGGGILIGENGVTSEPHVSLNLRNLTLRAIMDRVVKSPGFSVWVVSRYGDHKQYLSISID